MDFGPIRTRCRDGPTCRLLLSKHTNQVNGILRAVAEVKQADLIDLDRMMGSDEAYFMDPVHLHPDAVALKVENLSEGLPPILRRRTRVRHDRLPEDPEIPE